MKNLGNIPLNCKLVFATQILLGLNVRNDAATLQRSGEKDSANEMNDWVNEEAEKGHKNIQRGIEIEREREKKQWRNEHENRIWP